MNNVEQFPGEGQDVLELEKEEDIEPETEENSHEELSAEKETEKEEEPPKEEKLEKKEGEKAGSRGVGKVIGRTAYTTITSIAGVKFVTDLAGVLVKKGDIYNYLKEKGEVKEDKKEISQALDSIAESWHKRREARSGEKREVKGEIEENKELKNAIANFKEKLAEAKSLPEEEKKGFKESLAHIVSERSRKKKEVERQKQNKTNEALGAYLQTKVKGTRIAKDAFNTALTAGGLLALRGAVYGWYSLSERAHKADTEFTKKKLATEAKGKKETASRLAYVMKDTMVNSTVETVRALAFKGKTKESKSKTIDFVQALGAVMRGVGISKIAISEIVGEGVIGAASDSVAKFEEAFEKEKLIGIGGQIAKNFRENVERLGSFLKKESPSEIKPDANEVPVGNNAGTESAAPEGVSGAKEAPEVESQKYEIKRPEFMKEKPEVKIPFKAPEEGSETPVIPYKPGFQPEAEVEAEPEIETETVPEFPSVEYQGGTSVWNEIERQIEARTAFKEMLPENMNEAEQTYLVDYLKDRIAEDPAKYGLPEDINLDTPTKEQLENLDWDKLFEESSTAENLGKAVPSLTEVQKTDIAENNRILKEFAQKTGRPVTSERADSIVTEIKENFGGDVDKYMEMEKPLEPIGGEEVAGSGAAPENELVMPNKEIDKNVVEGLGRRIAEGKEEIMGREDVLKAAWNNPESLKMNPDFASVVKEIEPNIEEQFSSIGNLSETLGKGFLGMGRAGAEELGSATERAARAFGLSEDQSKSFVLYLSEGKELTKKTFREMMDGDSIDWIKFKDKIDSFWKLNR